MIADWHSDNWEHEAVDVVDEGALATLLARLRGAGDGLLVDLAHANGSTLIVGVGRGDSVLCYFDHGASWTSVGDYSRRGPELQFMGRSELSGFEAAMGVPFDQALAAAVEFFKTGVRPGAVKWDRDWA